MTSLREAWQAAAKNPGKKDVYTKPTETFLSPPPQKMDPPLPPQMPRVYQQMEHPPAFTDMSYSDTPSIMWHDGDKEREREREQEREQAQEQAYQQHLQLQAKRDTMVVNTLDQIVSRSHGSVMKKINNMQDTMNDTPAAATKGDITLVGTVLGFLIIVVLGILIFLIFHQQRWTRTLTKKVNDLNLERLQVEQIVALTPVTN